MLQEVNVPSCQHRSREQAESELGARTKVGGRYLCGENQQRFSENLAFGRDAQKAAETVLHALPPVVQITLLTHCLASDPNGNRPYEQS